MKQVLVVSLLAAVSVSLTAKPQIGERLPSITPASGFVVEQTPRNHHFWQTKKFWVATGIAAGSGIAIGLAETLPGTPQPKPHTGLILHRGQ